jgi:hypothetical protein
MRIGGLYFDEGCWGCRGAFQSTVTGADPCCHLILLLTTELSTALAASNSMLATPPQHPSPLHTALPHVLPSRCTPSSCPADFRSHGPASEWPTCAQRVARPAAGGRTLGGTLGRNSRTLSHRSRCEADTGYYRQGRHCRRC